MSKERLEEIQKIVNYAYRRDGSVNVKAVTMHIEHYEFLYKKAEREQYLTIKIGELHEFLQGSVMDIAKDSWGKHVVDASIHVIKELKEQVEQLESEKETLSMSHDSIHRELADYKRLNQKDKHELIKANISKIRKIEELESVLEWEKSYEKRNLALEQQNKRYRDFFDSVMELQLYVNYTEQELYQKMLEIVDEFLVEGEE